ncbi:MAG: exonuclease domain-containing protein, partial [Gammaproteobacteria bacterium]|nr:exonuclease domain-containing protein [Gammaproteobacteria bacterium]
SMRIIQHAHAGHDLELPAHHWLGELPAALLDLGTELHKARREISQALARGAAQAEVEKSRLETVVLELTEGVIVCDRLGRILLYNPAALKVLANEETVGLGRSLYDFCARAPVEHALEHLRGSDTQAVNSERDATFISSTVTSGTLLRCRLRLVSLDAHSESGFVLAFDDVTRQIDALRQRDRLLRRILDDLRKPLASVRAAAANLSSNPELDDRSRARLGNVVAEESAALNARLEHLSENSRSFVGRDWLMGEVYSSDLVRLVSNRLPADSGVQITMTGLPSWITVDSHALVLAICQLLQRLREHTGVGEFDIELSPGGDHAYLDLVWRGSPLLQATVDEWSGEPLPDAIGVQTVGDVVETHGGELSSRSHRREGYAVLRLPVPVPPTRDEERRVPLPARPEFYDFAQTTRAQSLGQLADRELTSLDYVVFDTETTGLRPSQGDQIISIGGVRIVNGRILSGETFEQLVNPGRSIPRASIRFHHITDDMVADEPPLVTVLPQFRQFVGNAVLVAHNSAFDMKFIRLEQARAGVVFDNPVLDTLLVSVYLHRNAQDQTLDGIARRLGVEVTARHTALGDALVTAEVLLRLLTLAEEQGVTTLGSLLAASEQMVSIRRMQERF